MKERDREEEEEEEEEEGQFTAPTELVFARRFLHCVEERRDERQSQRRR